MVKFRNLDRLTRKVRWGSLAEMGVPSWTLAQKAIRAGRKEEALELMEYARSETHLVRQFMSEFVAAFATYVAETWGEEELGKFWRHLLADRWRGLILDTVEDTIRLNTVNHRGLGTGRTGLGDLPIREEKDRYVMTLDPCGSGGQMRRSGQFGLTRQAHPWSWGKVGVPYYCTHCCVLWEILPTEAQGYPVRLHENVDQPQAPCLVLYYKKPELIPEGYFTRLGFQKDMSRLANAPPPPAGGSR